jgi:hypothetical protein
MHVGRKRGVTVAFNGQSKCAVSECGEPCSEWGNLCKEHQLPGIIVELEGGSGVVTIWYAEHEDESGVIFLNDWALGVHFGGAAGFMARLNRQGFVKVRNLTHNEFEAVVAQIGKPPGNWSGPWSTEYPWEAYEFRRIM